MQRSKESVVWTRTQGDIVHSGLVIEPNKKTRTAVVWVHGLYQNFTDKPGILVGSVHVGPA